MAYRSGKHDKSTKRMAGCGSKGAQRRARKKACLHGTRIAYSERVKRAGGQA